MSELEKVINKIFDEQEAKLKAMFAEALGDAMDEQKEAVHSMFGSCYEKYENELNNEQ